MHRDAEHCDRIRGDKIWSYKGNDRSHLSQPCITRPAGWVILPAGAPHVHIRHVQATRLCLFEERPSVWWFIDSGCHDRPRRLPDVAPVCDGAQADKHWGTVCSQISDSQSDHSWRYYRCLQYMRAKASPQQFRAPFPANWVWWAKHGGNSHPWAQLEVQVKVWDLFASVSVWESRDPRS